MSVLWGTAGRPGGRQPARGTAGRPKVGGAGRAEPAGREGHSRPGREGRSATRSAAEPTDHGIFRGRTALVTGAAGGIGSAIARALTAVSERGGRLDMLVNAAGIQLRVAAVDAAEEDWERLVAVNLSAACRLCRAAAVHLTATRGSIVNVSSLSADRAVAGIVPYGATKAALSQLTKGLAVELGPSGVRVNAVAPGYVRTPITEELLNQAEVRNRVLSHIPLGRLADGAEVADPVVFLLSGAARYITGVVLPVDGGYSITSRTAYSCWATRPRRRPGWWS